MPVESFAVTGGTPTDTDTDLTHINVAFVVLPPSIVDPDPSDDAATAEIPSVRIMDDGLESGDTSAWSQTAP